MTERIDVSINADAGSLIEQSRKASDAMQTLASKFEGFGTSLRDFATNAGQQMATVGDRLRDVGRLAGDAGERFVKFGQNAKVGFGELQNSYLGAAVAANALFAALDQVARAVAAPITEMLDAEQAAAMLQGTFGGLQTEIEAVSTLAGNLAANNAFFDDDALAQAAATLKLFGANRDAIEQLLPYVNNLAVAFGVDVNQAAEMVGQALMGQTRSLARMVPEVRGANSQMEVLAALEASAARNASIAEQRTSGLGGQLALLKRQAGDAAQGIGMALLPVINSILKAMNDHLLPAVGKVVAAFAGMGAFFDNLGKGFNVSQLMTKAGEAILDVESKFTAVTAKVANNVGNITAAAPGLDLKGQFGDKPTKETKRPTRTGGTGGDETQRAAALQRTYQATQKALNDEFTRAAREIADYYQKARDEAARRRQEDAAFVERQQAFQIKIAEEIAAIQKEAYDANVKASRDAAETYSNVISRAFDGDIKGAMMAASAGAAKQFGASLQGDMPALQGAFGDGIASMIEGAAPGIVGVFQKMVDVGVTATMNALERIYKNVSDIISEAGEFRKETAALTARAEAENDRQRLEFAQAQGRISEQQKQLMLSSIDAGENIARAIGLNEGDANAKGFAEAMQALFFDLTKNPEMQALVQEGLKKGNLFELLMPKIESGEVGGEGVSRLIGTALSGRGDAAMMQLETEILRFLQTMTENQKVGESPRAPMYVFDVTPKTEDFAFAPASYFFRAAATTRAVSPGMLQGAAI